MFFVRSVMICRKCRGVLVRASLCLLFQYDESRIVLNGGHVVARNMLSAGRPVQCRMMCNEFAVVQTEGKA